MVTTTNNLDEPLVESSPEESSEERKKSRANSMEVDNPICNVENIETGRASERKTSVASPKSDWVNDWILWAVNWTEDGIGVGLAFILFIASIIISETGNDLSLVYSWECQWPLGAIFVGLFVIVTAHNVLGKPHALSAYFSVLLIAVAARSVGDYSVLSKSGLSASLWAILFGICCRSAGMDFGKTIFSGEFFVKIGVTLLAMDFTSIAAIGLPGLMIAWGDTILVLIFGMTVCSQLFQFDMRDAIVVAGATCICGSSAATALSSSVHPAKYDDKYSKAIIAIMGVFNAPLMPLMPLVKTAGHMNPSVVGAWIGGSIDSTGQVVASAQMGGNVVLKTAVIIKMAQNILIGPLCLLFTGKYQKSFKPDILLSKFPLFVGGFLITSTVATLVLYVGDASETLKSLIIPNSWVISEWVTLIGFACIGLEIDIKKFFTQDATSTRVLMAYLVIQAFDICSTFGWAYLMFHNRNITDDDGPTDDATTTDPY